MSQIYCGNNLLNPQLVAGNVTLGTRYKCLRKGIGYGLYMPYDPNYVGTYMPIDQRKIYCGNKSILPNNYDSMGNLPQCIQKGIGIGKRLRARNSNNFRSSSTKPNNLNINLTATSFSSSSLTQKPFTLILFLLLAGILFIYLYVRKPSIVTSTKNNDNKKRIIWYKFMTFYISILILVRIIIFFVELIIHNI